MREPAEQGATDEVSFGPFTLNAARRELLLCGHPLALDDDGYAILAEVVAAAGSPVTETALLAALGAAGRAIDAGQLWARVATLNGVLDGGASDAAFIAHFPQQGFALVVPQADHRSHPMQRLPARVSTVIGCEDAIERIGARLALHRFVTIVGAGGMGKTTLATVLAEGMLASCRDGVCFVDLAPMADPRLLPNVLASALGIAIAPGASVAGLAAYLRDKQLLIVLDSCEHVVAAAASLVEQLLPAAPALHVLATSREPLLASGEWLYRHGPMRLPVTAQGIGAAQAIGYPAVQLFVERANASAPGFVLDDANAALVCAICQRLDGIPLAIELASTRVALLGVAGLAAQMAQRLLSAVSGRRSSVARHRTLSTMLDWSFDLLPPREQRALARLALYRGAFTLAAASALLTEAPSGAADAAESVLELMSKSLVARCDANPDCRLRLLDTTRAYASAKLDASGERRALMVRHARYLCGMFEIAEDDWLVMSRQQWLERYTIWIDDVRIGLDWAFSADGDIQLGMQLAAASFSLGHQASFTAEFGDRIERALQLIDSAGVPALLPETAMRALQCNVHSRFAQEDEALQRALQAASEAPVGSALRKYRTALSTGWWASAFIGGDFPLALKRAELIGTHAREDGDKVHALIAERTMAQALHFLGRQAEARVSASNVLANSWRKIALVFNPSQVDVRVSMRIVLARIAWMDGCPDLARTIAAECLQHAAADTAVALAQALALCSVPIALWRGERDVAAELVEQLVLHVQRHSLDYWFEWALRYRDVLAMQGGDMAAAQRLATPAAILFENMQRDHLVTFDVHLLAADSIARVESGVAGWCAPELLRAQAEQQARQGMGQAAESLLLRSLGLARAQHTLGWELRGASSLARLWQQQGRGAGARALLAPVVARFTEGTDTADVVAAMTLLARL